QISATLIGKNKGRYFILHEEVGSSLGYIWAMDTLPQLPWVNGMKTGVSYYISAVVATEIGDTLFWQDPCLSVSEPISVTYQPKPPSPQINGPTRLCPGQMLRLSLEVEDSMATYEWRTPWGLQVTTEPWLVIPHVTLAMAGDYQVLLEKNHCRSDYSAIFNLVVDDPGSLADAGADQYLCPGETLWLAASPPDLGISGEWQTVADAFIFQPNQASSEVEFLGQGPKLFIWELSSPECPAYDSDSLWVWPISSPQANDDSLFLALGRAFTELDLWQNDFFDPQFSLQSDWVDPNVSDWSFIEWTQAGQIRYQASDGVVRGQQLRYSLCQAAAHCPLLCDTASLYIWQEIDPQDPGLSIPNAITPNDDGVNDLLIIDGMERYPKSELSILNRWGDLVFYARPYLNDWGGTYEGQPLPEGTYYYILRTDLGNKRDLKGSISILR
ncbi:MAG: gliding motility-associated C-terminal domain-containing protein, partial [Bacteroidota bacterium]